MFRLPLIAILAVGLPVGGWAIDVSIWDRLELAYPTTISSTGPLELWGDWNCDKLWKPVKYGNTQRTICVKQPTAKPTGRK